MNVIVPLNVTAIRVNANDNSNLVSQFKGRVAAFEGIPWGSSGKGASTGDSIALPLEQQSGPANPLGTGIHIHWNLPDYFRRGVQQPDGRVVFPQAPNRWLVIRYLSVFDTGLNNWGSVKPKAFIVESDFIGSTLWTDAYKVNRPTVSVPLPVNQATNTQPFMFMGRVLNYEDWNPSAEKPSQFLPSYKDQDGQSLYLTSIGFVGPGFCAYYPECCSVFGFWDHFKDNPALFQAIGQNLPLQFKASYQVIGWLDPAAPDPIADIGATVKTQYNAYIAQCKLQNVPPKQTPVTVLQNIAEQQLHWSFNAKDITFTLNSDNTLASLTAPTRTLVAGMVQEVVWNMLSGASTTYFLNNPAGPQPSAAWTDTVEVAAGNTTAEALSALLKFDMGSTVSDPDLLKNYEYLLDALQLGLLQNLEAQPAKMIYLDESLHAKAFSQNDGGWVWNVEPPLSDPNTAPDPNAEVTLPLEVAEQLALLNQAQKQYDQGRLALGQMRRQLFMDWMRYVKMYAGKVTDPYVSLAAIQNFLVIGNDGELNAVISASNATGILQYMVDSVSGQIIGLNAPAGSGSLANAVYSQFQTVEKLIQPQSGWMLVAAPAPAFYSPTDPVLLLEGQRIQPAQRNGTDTILAVRLSADLLSTLALEYNGSNFSVAAISISGMPAITATVPCQDDVQALVGEAYLLAPMLAGGLAAILQAQGGNNNPAIASVQDFTASLMSAQGGLSPLDGGPGAGLFAAIHAAEYTPAANPAESVTTPQEITFTFTNSTNNGWAPSPIAWSAQQALPSFTSTRVDPFLPVYLIWGAQIDPLKWNDGRNYTASNLTDFFSLNTDAVDYLYNITGNVPASFTAGSPTNYFGSVVLATKPTYSLTSQIQAYIANFPKDPADPTLEQIQQLYAGRNFMSQAISGFNVEQTLRSYIAQISVQNLVSGSRDVITKRINDAANVAPQDNWYDFAFNNVTPIATGLLAQHNFGPLRSGFMGVTSLEIVDVFGQRMQLTTAALNRDGTFQVVPAMTMQPASGDTVNQNKIYLAPRLLPPTRLWFRWLSAEFNTQVSGITGDFVEMNSHPATSPVCGWILPNHLDNSLFFYGADGSAIGSFGLEHGSVVYRTRAGNLANPGSTLEDDIGPQGQPTINEHIANFMWYLNPQSNGQSNGQSAAFLSDLLTTIQNSDMFINPAAFGQDAGLAVLIGRPLALVRAVLSLESSGGLLPLSQADTSAGDPFPQDVNNRRFNYADRQPYSSANLGSVQFPVRMGDLANVDDGLVGYLIEAPGDSPYSIFYSAAAPAGAGHGVVQPTATTIELTLNAQPIVMTMLVDPRATVHATTGVLPVAGLDIPPDQYSQGMAGLAMTFFATPVLSKSQELVVPVPPEQGYDWFWITPGAIAATPLSPSAANSNAVYNYTPQNVLEGWLKLAPQPKK